jgi:Raf kinase inhibitor-like YbhB/YbcL family protein
MYLLKWAAPALATLSVVLCGPVAAMTVSSADIAPNATIAARHVYTQCGGGNLSPQLAWSGAPKTTKSFVITMIDVDVKPAEWSHWIVIQVPAGVTSMPRGSKPLPGHAVALMTDFGDAAYGGPCPPKGTGVHHYQITVWAMPTETVAFEPKTTARGVVARLTKLAIDHATFTGTVRG